MILNKMINLYIRNYEESNELISSRRRSNQSMSKVKLISIKSILENLYKKKCIKLEQNQNSKGRYKTPKSTSRLKYLLEDKTDELLRKQLQKFNNKKQVCTIPIESYGVARPKSSSRSGIRRLHGSTTDDSSITKERCITANKSSNYFNRIDINHEFLKRKRSACSNRKIISINSFNDCKESNECKSLAHHNYSYNIFSQDINENSLNWLNPDDELIEYIKCVNDRVIKKLKNDESSTSIKK